MFDSLRKKFASLMKKPVFGKKEEEAKSGKEEKEDKEKAKKPSEAPKKPKKEFKEDKQKTEAILPEKQDQSFIEEEIEQEAKEESKQIEQSIEKEVEEIKEEEKIETPEYSEKEETPGFFKRLANKITSSKLSEEDFEEFFAEFEITLLENNVALEVVDKIKSSLSWSLVGQQVKKQKAESKILESLKSAILSVLIEPPNLIEQIKEKQKNHPDSPYVILFFGINGSGKTTSIAKLANLLKKQKISCVLAAADTFRAASIEQLETHANKIQVPIIKSKYEADPASVAFDAISHAKAHKIQVVLIDTAGRMYTKSNLMKEMEKIVRVSKPDLKLFIGESITGNDATQQAKMFAETAGIDGIILSKADVDEKAGTILSVSSVTNKPIYYLGVGQGLNDLAEFKKKDILKNLGLE